MAALQVSAMMVLAKRLLLMIHHRMALVQTAVMVVVAAVEVTEHMNDPIQQLAQDLNQFAQARDWQQFHSPKNLASALTVEAGELLEHFQWLTEAQSRQLDDDKRQAVAFEMADVLLYLVQLSSALNIDLMDAARRKMVINAQRYPVEQSRGNSKKHGEL
jgi:NTP pyrophosphatase (non-canonical NTP hydrolase)